MKKFRLIKQLTPAEVGEAKTHEVYVRLPNDFDYEQFFNHSDSPNGSVIEVNFNVTVLSKKESIDSSTVDLRFVYFQNSNKEKRIPSLSPLFKQYNVQAGDVICLESSTSGDSTTYTLTIYSSQQISITPNAVVLEMDDAFDKDEKAKPDNELSDKPYQIIFYGAPGTGKSYAIDKMADPNRTIRTTFHPDSDYASFVGAYKPTMARVPIVAFDGTRVTNAKGVDGHDGREQKIVYKYVPQSFLKAYVAAWSDLSQPYYLVIEEINRGNCAQIFGDLFQLLDRNNMGSSSYAIAADEDITQFLATDENGFANIPDSAKNAIRSFILTKDDGQTLNIGDDIINGKKLLLPPNLYIWATMNTSDQSLFPIDSAFKRRWNWEYVPIDYSKENWTFVVGNNRYYWGDFLKKMNPIISDLTESPDKQMGYFFAKADVKSKPNLKANDTISEKLFLNKVLFYLWTDVLKDFDAGKEPFINPDTKKAYEFSEFFDKSKDYLSQFIAKPELGLSPIDELSEPVEDYDTDGKVHKYGKFLANGIKSDTITWTVYILLRDFAKSANFATIKSLVDATIDRDEDVIKTVENPKAYQKENGWLKDVITTSDGVSFVVTNQWKSAMIPMIKQLAEKVNGTFEQVYE